MRNLARYPITLREMLTAIKRAADTEVDRLGALKPEQVPIGDVHLAALQEAWDRLQLVKPQLYLDCDGVLADFDKRVLEIFGSDPRGWEESVVQENLHLGRERAEATASEAFWNKLYAVENLFESFDVCVGAEELVAATKHLNPIILTGCPRGYWAVPQKLRWRDQHFPDLPMICVESVNKRVHCRPGDVLVDDWGKYQKHWEEEGGVFVLHTSTADTLSRLRELGLL